MTYNHLNGHELTINMEKRERYGQLHNPVANIYGDFPLLSVA
jgi:hypothetical protein